MFELKVEEKDENNSLGIKPDYKFIFYNVDNINSKISTFLNLNSLPPYPEKREFIASEQIKLVKSVIKIFNNHYNDLLLNVRTLDTSHERMTED
jgi:hypothetical protein